MHDSSFTAFYYYFFIPSSNRRLIRVKIQDERGGTLHNSLVPNASGINSLAPKPRNEGGSLWLRLHHGPVHCSARKG